MKQLKINYTKIFLGLFFMVCFIPFVYGQERPNVILILADDMALGDIGALNGQKSRTPNIDKLMESSVNFSRAYSASAVCTPARAALLTGKYPHRTGAITLNMERFPAMSRVSLNELTVADMFKEEGYVTGLIGKWHIGDGDDYHPLKRGFQEFVGFKGFDVEKDYYNYQLDIQGTYKQYKNQYLTDILTENAIDFVERHRSEPFFLHLAYYTPHRPLSAPQELIDFYLSKGYSKNTATIYAMIEVMDAGIGKLMNALESKNILKNTIVVFASDNGPDPVVGTRFNLGQRGTKYTVYEGGIHVPFMISWKDRFIPGTSDEIIHFTDVLPTLLDICNIQSPSKVRFDGASFKSILMGKSKEAVLPQYRFWQWNRGVPYYSHNAAIREGDWKLVYPYVTRNMVHSESDKKPQLFNLREDPYENNDLSKEEEWRYNTMWTKLEEWSRRVELDRLLSQ